MFDFPSAPSNGQQVTAPNGAVYAWNGTSWAPVSIGLPAYAPLASPVFTGDARAVTPAYGDNDTSIPTTAFVQSAVAPVANNTGRNLVMNGAFAVAQRGAGPFTTAVYTLDRWLQNFNLDTVSTQRASLADGDRASIGDEAAKFAYQTTMTGNAGAAAYTQIVQKIEGVQRLGNKTVTVSFWGVGSVAALKVGVGLDQNFGTGGSPSAQVTPNATPLTLTTSWARYTVTITLPSTSGKTLGTNGDDCVWLKLWLSSGANTNVIAGSIGVQSGTFTLYGIQLEIGTQATPFDAGGTPADQLRQCQRFYQVISATGGAGYSVAGTVVQVYLEYPQMRAAPTATPTWGTNTNYSPTATPQGNGLLVSGTASATGQWGFNLSTCTLSADL